MPAAAVVAPLLVAVVLVVGGVAKTRTLAELARAFEDLEVPRVLSGPLVVRAVPVVEVVLGVALVVAPAPAYVVVAVLALLLLLAYLGLVARAVARGRQVDCDCFGGLAEAQVSGRTVARNVLLVVAAGVAVADGVAGESAAHRLLGLSSSGWSWLLAVAVTAVLVALVLGPTTEPGPPLVEDVDLRGIPYLVLQRPDGTTVSLPELASLRPQLLVTLSATCHRCEAITEVIADWPEQVPELDVHVVTGIPLGEDVPSSWPGVLHDPDDRVRPVLGMARPSAVLLGADALVAGGPVHGASAVREMFEEICEQLADQRAR